MSRILFTVGGACSGEGSGPGRVPGPRGCLVPGGCRPGRVPGGDPPETTTAAGGTHPTGIHSCFFI